MFESFKIFSFLPKQYWQETNGSCFPALDSNLCKYRMFLYLSSTVVQPESWNQLHFFKDEIHAKSSVEQGNYSVRPRKCYSVEIAV